MKTTLGTESSSDTQLVEWSLTGDREAFGRIVERYQSLVCSITYGATGSVALSEDIAQETFLTAWRELAKLSDAARLRGWLCGITRNLVNNYLRRGQRDPVQTSDSLDIIHEPASTEPSPSAQAVSREEEAIVWNALGRIPDTYREPLILFYREGQSVERVATSLELSEDAVKQRLSRGRKLLTDEVAAFVEGTLKRTTPGKAFTLGVLAALPVFATSAKAATIGAVAAKGSIAAKAAASVGLAGAILGPIIGGLGGCLGGWLGAKVSIENTESSRERQFMIRMAWITWVFVVVVCLAIFALIFAARFLWKTHPVLIAAVFIGMMLGYGVALAVLIVWGNRVQSRIRAEEAAKLPLGTLPPGSEMSSPWKVSFSSLEYRSRWTLLGLPLIHVRMNCKQDGKELPAKGWIAVGGIAYGVLFAFGTVAIAPISIGGVFAVGLLSLGGGCAVGLLSLGGGLGLGVWSMGGGLAIGLLAFGGCAIGWTAALGGAAFAREFARGGLALAQHANDAAAGAFIQNNAFLQNALAASRHAYWLTLLALMPLALLWWRMKKARAKRSSSNL
jgi:RNA polymerase sigma factor (sigma-70 family)